MSIEAVNGPLGGLAAAQSMVAAATQAPGSVGFSGADDSDGGGSASTANVAEEASVAVLRMALDQERSLVNILV